MKKIIIFIIIVLLLIPILFLAFKREILSYVGWDIVKPSAVYPTNDWLVSNPEKERIDSKGLIKGYQYIIDNKINAHSLLIIRNGKIVDETYFYPYQKEDMINIHSCTKSIISALIGVAIKEGYIKDVDQKILDFFPDMKIDNLSPEKQSITIRNLLTMSAGLAVKHPDEDMKSSGNWVQYVLDLKMSESPGTKFNYSDATAHLLSAILQNATGMSTYDYANTRLFQSMGIKVIWPTDPQGVYYGFGEINMTPRDMAKFGYLYLNRGVWDGKQLVPADWVKESTKRQIKTGLSDDYGYLWWCPDIGFRAEGLGEQVISVIPLFNTVTVCTNGLHDGQSFNFKPFDDANKFMKLSENQKDYSELKALEQQAASAKEINQNKMVPKIATKVSGKRYFFAQDNSLNLNELQIDFSQEKETIVNAGTFGGGQAELHLPLDGSYVKDLSRKSRNDTLFVKGYWQDDKTFIIVYEKSAKEIMYCTFENNTVSIRSDYQGKVVFDKLVGKQR